MCARNLEPPRLGAFTIVLSLIALVAAAWCAFS